jgi:hypothetical protein
MSPFLENLTLGLPAGVSADALWGKNTKRGKRLAGSVKEEEKL